MGPTACTRTTCAPSRTPVATAAAVGQSRSAGVLAAFLPGLAAGLVAGAYVAAHS